ncbi:prepilin peptidase [Halovulum sp. GXIMD14793]
MSAELILFLAALPFGFWAAFQDLSRMKLPNRMNIAIAVVFLVIGPFLFPFEEYLWRIAVGVAIIAAMFFFAILCFEFWAAFLDLSRMTLLHKVVIAIMVILLIAGYFLTPKEDYIRYAGTGVGTFAALLFLSLTMEQIGGGDLKFLAVVLPWVGLTAMSFFIIILAGAILCGFVLHRWARQQRCIRALAPRWVSWRRKRYPMGLSISAAWLVTLGLSAFSG